MNPIDLIGCAGAAFLANTLATDGQESGTARFLLDRLTGRQVAAICKAVLKSPVLSERIQMRIPRDLVASQDLPEEILTDERTTHWRTAPCDKPALLLANTDDDQGQSLKEVMPLDSGLLCSQTSVWVTCAAEGLGLSERETIIWQRALAGLLDAKPVSLDMFAAYIIATRKVRSEHEYPVTMALGWALPELRAPRHLAVFNAIREQLRTHASQWKRLYQQVFSKRSPYLQKFTPTQQPITVEQLQETWERIKLQVIEKHHPTFEAFINAPNKWTAEAAALAELDWEQDNVQALFLGLKQQRDPLGKATAVFFEEEYPDSLTDVEEEYLERLDTRNTSDASDEDKEFYERHRTDLAKSRTLKSRWDKFIYGQPIECDDFQVGVLRALERLFEQAGPAAEQRSLQIESSRKSRLDWREMNTDALWYFSRRYRGLYSLTRKEVQWNAGDLFSYERVVDREKQGGKYKTNDSASKAANQLKFYVTLDCKAGTVTDSYTTQIIWTFNPNSILSQYAYDLERLAKHPLLVSHVSRETVSKKGKLQAVDLDDVSTLHGAYRKDGGSLVPAYERLADWAIQLPSRLDQARQKQQITADAYGMLMETWRAFVNAYSKAIEATLTEGVSASACLELESPYIHLLEGLLTHAVGDGNRKNLWEPILAIGLTAIDGGPPAAILAPWHPLRLLGMAAKTRQLAGLIKHLINENVVCFGDARVFFQDIAEELRHPYYPEVCLGMYGSQPVLLASSDCTCDYTLMERPVTGEGEDDATNENPAVIANELLQLVQEYLRLQPHEAANLSAVLYNCNSARLPQATVNVLGGLQEDDDEVRCQVILRHSDPDRLHELYEKLLEGSDDGDDYVASEASRDFMARLRIGIMADSAPVQPTDGTRPADIVFMQDVIARLAQEDWVIDPAIGTDVDILHHVPPRWSRRRPGTRDDLRSVAYLACPNQPCVGWHYLQALYGVTRGTDVSNKLRPLPVRQISFQNNSVRDIFGESHRLGHWVVNCDELLTRRQLRNQGVQVIRHRQQRYSGRSIIISSTAPLSLLHVMIQRRLQELSLDLDDDALESLARRFVDLATEISGDIVLRAAKRGQFAKELIGLVLSRYLIEDELANRGNCAWYFLDDYAGWLGQKTEHIADILALSPRKENNEVTLVALVGEAKYVASDSLSDACRSSAVQLRQTMCRIQDALFGNPGRLDRNLWLSRFADMMLDGIEVPATQAQELHEWRNAVREGSAKILLKGLSHVFVHTQQPDEQNPSERSAVGETDLSWQEVYGRENLRRIVLAFSANQSPRAIREQLGGEFPWDKGEPRLPTKQVLWADVPRSVHGRDITVPDKHTATPADRDKDPSSTSKDPEHVVEVQVNEVSVADLPTVEAITRSERDKNSFVWAPAAMRTLLCQLSPPQVGADGDEVWLRGVESTLRTALIGYNLQAKVLDHRLTPNAALIRLQGSNHLRIQDVEQRRKELLTTHGLQITNVTPEPGQVVISIARPNRQLVNLLDVWRRRTLANPIESGNQSLVVGVREADGEILYLRPGDVHAPHTLVAGTTGSGKSILIQNLLLDIAATNTPMTARITLIDPKQGADYLHLQGLPHISEGIIVKQDDAREVLEATVAEMDRRYDIFRQAEVANLVQYNKTVPADQREPVIWVFHDEFAAWMLTDTYKDTVSNVVQRLGVMARAAGVFLIFAAQRPEDRVMPVQLRDNLGNRLVLRVESPGTSMIALGEEGAERLLGKGHLAARLQGEDAVVFAQVPILPYEHLKPLVEAIKSLYKVKGPSPC